MKFSLPGWSWAMFFLFVTASGGMGQVVSRFDFNSTATFQTATVGVNAVYANPDAVSPNGFAYINSGCNPNSGLDLVVPGEQFMLDNFSVEVRYRRQPTEFFGNFFDKDQFSFGFQGGRVFIRYRTVDSLGNTSNVNMNVNFTIPTNQVGLYKFSYDHCTGTGLFTYDGDTISLNDGPDLRGLSWTNDWAFIGLTLDNVCAATMGLDWIEISGNNNACAPLPIELASFTGRPVSQGVDLRWTTLTETNNDFFTLERSVDGMRFSEIATIQGAGTTQLRQTYRFLDMDEQSGQAWYRLRQTDLDGNNTVTESILVSLEGLSSGTKVWPNPASQSLNIQPFHPESEEAIELDMVLRSLTGREVARGNSSVLSGEILQMDVSTLPPGYYFLEVRGNGPTVTQRVQVLR